MIFLLIVQFVNQAILELIVKVIAMKDVIMNFPIVIKKMENVKIVLEDILMIIVMRHVMNIVWVEFIVVIQKLENVINVKSFILGQNVNINQK